MPHPLVAQLRFARSELRRALEGLSEEDAGRRLMPMNSIGWIVGHLAWQEQRYWLTRLQGRTPLPALNELFCFGCPGITPSLAEMWRAWDTVTAAAEPVLDAITSRDLAAETRFVFPDGSTWATSAGNLMNRVIGHYWYHIGECMAIRQLLGHTDLPDFVGDIDTQAPYALG